MAQPKRRGSQKPASRQQHTQRTTQSRRPGRRSSAAKKSIWHFPWTKSNFMIAGIGVAVILVGFLLMSTGVTEEPAVPDGKWNNFFAVQLAPVLLIIGYCGIIPYAIIKYFKKDEQS